MADGEMHTEGLSPAQVAEVEAAIRELFGKVLEAAEKILTADGHFGYLKIAEKIDPRIEDILLGLRALESIFDIVIDAPLFQDEHSFKNSCLNAKQCVWHIKMINSALQSKNEEAYHRAIHELQTQHVA